MKSFFLKNVISEKKNSTELYKYIIKDKYIKKIKKINIKLKNYLN